MLVVVRKGDIDIDIDTDFFFFLYQEDPRSQAILVGISREISGLKILYVIANERTMEAMGADKKTQNDSA